MTVRTALLTALLGTILGCSGGDPCAGSPCPNDSRPTQSEYQSCVNQHNANANKACNAQVVAYELCVQGNILCGSNGTTDASASSSRISNNCKQALDSAICCALGLSSCK